MNYHGTVDINGKKTSVFTVERSLVANFPIINFKNSSRSKKEIKEDLMTDATLKEGLTYDDRLMEVWNWMCGIAKVKSVEELSYEMLCYRRSIAAGLLYQLPYYVCFEVEGGFLCGYKLNTDGSYEIIEDAERFHAEVEENIEQMNELIESHPEHWSDAT